MILTTDLIQSVTGDAARWYGPLEAACQRRNVYTPERVAMFLAQCAHESGGFRHLVENLRYSAAGLLRTWPTRFTRRQADALAYNEKEIAERAYGGRLGNGPVGSGDGFRYRGRGIIQLTGKDNYARCGAAIGRELLASPDLLAQPLEAAQSAGWFWAMRGCNELADAGDYRGVTYRINGGYNGMDSRAEWLAKVRAAMEQS